MSFSGIYPEGWESIYVKGGVLSTELQQMCYKALPQATCYFCILSELIGFSHLCEISMFFLFFFLITSVVHQYKDITDLATNLCHFCETQNISFVPSSSFLYLKWYDFFAHYFTFQIS